MGGNKTDGVVSAKQKDKAADTPSNTDEQQQATSQVVADVQTTDEAKTPVTDPPELTEGQVTEQSLAAKEESQISKTAISETQDNKKSVEQKDVKPKKSPVTKKVTETPKQTDAQVKTPEKNPFELRIKNNGRRRLLQFCGVFLESGQTTTVTLKNQLEVDHVKDTLRQFNELAGRNDLVVEEAE